MKPNHTSRRNRRGANALEFGLVMPVFALLMGSLVDLSWQAYQQAALESAAHFGCRQGSLIDPGLQEKSIANVVTKTEGAMVSWLQEHGGSCGQGCKVSVAAIGARPVRSLQCRVGVQYAPLVGILLSERTLTAEAVVRLEYQRSL
jgi:hypothetical protein